MFIMAVLINTEDTVDIEKEADRTSAIANSVIDALPNILNGTLKLSQYPELCNLTLTSRTISTPINIYSDNPSSALHQQGLQVRPPEKSLPAKPLINKTTWWWSLSLSLSLSLSVLQFKTLKVLCRPLIVVRGIPDLLRLPELQKALGYGEHGSTTMAKSQEQTISVVGLLLVFPPSRLTGNNNNNIANIFIYIHIG
ncbi:unnamed protein product [Acanthosepion pharaonis]|uniref:Uncharacterized protein n=1 Tax=Acanthosepion pharaonis TaxID=158019 RepID=A0A812BVY1_ACAPH|nr:unnamed protein product [Sepia pharaonis]